MATVSSTEPDRLIRVTALARRWGVGRRTVARWFRERGLHIYKPGGPLAPGLVKVADAEKVLATSLIRAAGPA